MYTSWGSLLRKGMSAKIALHILLAAGQAHWHPISTCALAKATVFSSLTKKLETYSSPNVATALRPGTQDIATSVTPQQSQQHLSSLSKMISALCINPRHSLRHIRCHPQPDLHQQLCLHAINCGRSTRMIYSLPQTFMHYWRKSPQNHTRIEDTPLILQPGSIGLFNYCTPRCHLTSLYKLRL